MHACNADYPHEESYSELECRSSEGHKRICHEPSDWMRHIGGLISAIRLPELAWWWLLARTTQELG